MKSVAANKTILTAKVIALFAVVIAWSGTHAAAAEIEIRSQANCAGVIRLGDIADLYGASDEEIARLSKVELGPAPRPGTSQWISQREIQDALWRRNIDYVTHRFRGASRVEVKNSAVVSANFSEQQSGLRAMPLGREAATESLKKIVLDFLRQRVDAHTDWRVGVELNREQAEILNRHAVWEIASVPQRPVPGNIEAWLGQHQIVFEPVSGGTAPHMVERVHLSVDIALPPTVVTLRYDVRSGTVITASHVQVEPVEEGKGTLSEPLRLQDVVGKELIRTAYAGQPLDNSMIRSPQLVKKSDAVTVVVNNGPVRLRAIGVAMADGALGELIDVQSEFQKEHFTARVVGPGTVEVNLAAGANTAQSASPQTTTSRNPNPPARSPGFAPPPSAPGRARQSGYRGETGGANQPTALPGSSTSTNGGNTANRTSQLQWRQR